jgi:hypothetical protein
VCKNKQGEIVGEEKDVLEVWATYLNPICHLLALLGAHHILHFSRIRVKELLNLKTNIVTSEETIYFGPESDITAPTLQETLGVIKNLNNNRAPWEDSVISELIKYGGRKLWNRIHQLIITIWETEQVPQEWGTAIICPIYKKGDKL